MGSTVMGVGHHSPSMCIQAVDLLLTKPTIKTPRKKYLLCFLLALDMKKDNFEPGKY